jgi:hypothetical protein
LSGLCGIAGRQEDQHEQPHSNLKSWHHGHFRGIRIAEVCLKLAVRKRQFERVPYHKERGKMNAPADGLVDGYHVSLGTMEKMG